VTQKFSNRLQFIVLALAVLFSITAFAQYYFTHGLLIRAVTEQLDTWGQELAKELGVADRWDLHGFRRASSAAPDYYIVANDGLIVDVQGFAPGLLPKVPPPSWPVYDEPTIVRSSVDEEWTLFGKRLRDGIVLLGIAVASDVNDAPTRLKENASQFGTTVDAALRVKRRNVDPDIDYAVVDDSGELRQMVGGIPLTTNRSAISETLGRGPLVYVGSDPYFLYPVPVRNEKSEDVGTIVLLRNIRAEQQMLWWAVIFNVGLAAFCWVVTAGLIALHSYRLRGRRLSCEEAYAQEECQTVEFKSSLRWDYKQQKSNKEVEWAVIKTVAAFLNTEGGILLIGVDDKKVVLGLEPDYQTLTQKPNKDGFELALQQRLTDAIGPKLYARNVRVGFCQIDGKDICIVAVRPAQKPVFVQDTTPTGRTDTLYVRVGNATKPLSVKDALAYADERWG
jgi:hypothetical protein